jgi:hypothetical protein
MRGGIRRQGDDTWQVRVYNSAARRREYFTVRARGRGHAATFTTSISGALNPTAERRRIPSLVVR